MHSVRAHWRRNSRTFLPLLVLSILVLSLFYLRGEQSVVWDPATGPASTKGTNTPIDPNVPLIPPKIWQIFFPPNSYKRDDRFNTGVDPSLLGDTVSWLVKNPKYEYVLVGNKYGDDFVDKHYPNSRVGQIYHLLLIRTPFNCAPEMLRTVQRSRNIPTDYERWSESALTLQSIGATSGLHSRDKSELRRAL